MYAKQNRRFSSWRLVRDRKWDHYVVTQLIEKGQVAAKKLSDEEFVSIEDIKAIKGVLLK